MELNKIYNQEALAGMAEIEAGTVDMILTDLPYGTTRNNWDSIIPLDAMWQQFNRVIKPNGAIVLTSQQPFTTRLISSNPKRFRYEWIWQKSIATGFLNARRMPLKKHENVLVFYQRLPTYNPQYTMGKPYMTRTNKASSNYGHMKPTATIATDGKRYPVDVLNIKSETGLHPTQKPVGLMAYMINTYTNAGETVLDCCMGSGTTAIAAIQTGRNFIGFELNKDYCDVANKRISTYQSQK
ncbi:DNA-methyltransferase [Lacticaseibacillus daqingensis]|uniref:DNA-methyltransferase n=1 Tax=Lacticaseibacillus daqingensis TaxID=2486014 RepID=UPI000F7932F0|nr:site-specific DNA-methyltransferase [Lacticaseibacillus daqingensis]